MFLSGYTLRLRRIPVCCSFSKMQGRWQYLRERLRETEEKIEKEREREREREREKLRAKEINTEGGFKRYIQSDIS